MLRLWRSYVVTLDQRVYVPGDETPSRLIAVLPPGPPLESADVEYKDTSDA